MAFGINQGQTLLRIGKRKSTHRGDPFNDLTIRPDQIQIAEGILAQLITPLQGMQIIRHRLAPNGAMAEALSSASWRAWVSTMRRYVPSLSIRSSCDPSSMIWPRSSTIRRLALRSVE